MELSFGEIVVLAILAFVVLGPDELVRQSRRLGRFVGKIRTEARNFRIMAEEEILSADLKKDLMAPIAMPEAELKAREAPKKEGDGERS